MMNKKSLALAALPFLAAAIIYGLKTNQPEQNQINDNSAKAVSGPIKEFNITARQWSFEPAQITVNRGDKVKLNLTSADVPHGLSIREYGINQTIQPGQTATVEFTADQPGEFIFFCSVFCGGGHREQRGVLIVK